MLATTLTLVLLALLAGVFTHRHLLLDQRVQRNQQRALLAFEAAGAGLAWSVSRLNAGRPLDAQCEPGALGTSWPQLLQAGGAPSQVAARCHTSPDGQNAWACTCAPTGQTTAPSEATAATAAAQGFAVTVSPLAGHPDTALIQVEGCANEPIPCAAPVRLSAAVNRLPALPHAPAAALSVRGATDLRLAHFRVSHADPRSGGVTFQGGGSLLAGSSTDWLGPPATPSAHTQQSDDAALASMGSETLFIALFQIDLASWRQLPTVRSIDCQDTCDAPLSDWLAPAAPGVLAWLPHGLHVRAALTLGSPTRPVVLVIDGPVRIDEPTVVHGLIFLRQGSWQDLGGLQLNGALVVAEDFAPQGISHIQHNADVLGRLRQELGTYVQVPGTWRDF